MLHRTGAEEATPDRNRNTVPGAVQGSIADCHDTGRQLNVVFKKP